MWSCLRDMTSSDLFCFVFITASRALSVRRSLNLLVSGVLLISDLQDPQLSSYISVLASRSFQIKSIMHCFFSFLAMFMGMSMASPYDLFASNLAFGPVSSEDHFPDLSEDDSLFNPPDPSQEIYNNVGMGSQIPLDETYADANIGDHIPLDNPGDFGDMLFSFESNPPDTTLALLDPELQSLEHAPSCPEDTSIFCCDPTKEFIPAAVEGCIYCTTASCFRTLPHPLRLV